LRLIRYRGGIARCTESDLFGTTALPRIKALPTQAQFAGARALHLEVGASCLKELAADPNTSPQLQQAMLVLSPFLYAENPKPRGGTLRSREAVARRYRLAPRTVLDHEDQLLKHIALKIYEAGTNTSVKGPAPRQPEADAMNDVRRAAFLLGRYAEDLFRAVYDDLMAPTSEESAISSIGALWDYLRAVEFFFQFREKGAEKPYLRTGLRTEPAQSDQDFLLEWADDLFLHNGITVSLFRVPFGRLQLDHLVPISRRYDRDQLGPFWRAVTSVEGAPDVAAEWLLFVHSCKPYECAFPDGVLCPPHQVIQNLADTLERLRIAIGESGTA
jgi:hypothetical protein